MTRSKEAQFVKVENTQEAQNVARYIFGLCDQKKFDEALRVTTDTVLSLRSLKPKNPIISCFLHEIYKRVIQALVPGSIFFENEKDIYLKCLTETKWLGKKVIERKHLRIAFVQLVYSKVDTEEARRMIEKT